MENMFLSVHNLLRWGVLIVGFYAVIKALIGWQGNKPFTNADNKTGMIFTLFVHLQTLVGLFMYFFTSSITKSAMQDMGGAMKNSELRYWAVEHLSIMLIAAVLITIGRSKSKRASTDILKHKKAFIFFGIGLILILSMIPWAFGSHPRPWFRF
jgi:hypothetical protein